MLDIKFIRENPDIVRDNIKKKFQEEKIPLVDEVISLDKEIRELKVKGDNLRQERNSISDEIGKLYRNKRGDEAASKKERVISINEELKVLEKEEEKKSKSFLEKMMVIPNIIADDVPIGEDDSKNVEIERFGEAFVPCYEIPHHADIIESLVGLDKESAGMTSGNGFYYLLGDVARLHEAMLAYARDFMIDKGFIYCIPPFMIHGDVVSGVMSFPEMEAMMYKIQDEDLYLIGTSEHSMIGRFKGKLLDSDELPALMTSYSPCFRKEVGAHGIEERGLYRVHQFEKQEMIVLCKEEEAASWYDKLWQYTVEFFRSMGISVRTLACCSGDLADLKYKSCDVEAWSPRQQKYFEVGSCSNLTTAQARRLGIRMRTDKGNKFVCTLNNTVIASPRALIAVIEQCYQEDGSVVVPEVLRPYMGGADVIRPKGDK